MTGKRLTTFHARERGAAMVEAAIAMMLLAVVLLGIIQYGLILSSYITLRNASAVGARVGVLRAGGATDSEIRTAVRSAVTPMLDPTLLPDGSIAITRDTAADP